MEKKSSNLSVRQLRIGQTVWYKAASGWKKTTVIRLTDQTHRAYTHKRPLSITYNNGISTTLDKIRLTVPPPEEIIWKKNICLGIDKRKVNHILDLLKKGHTILYEGRTCPDTYKGKLDVDLKVVIKAAPKNSDIIVMPATSTEYTLNKKQLMERLMSATDTGKWYIIHS